jgi:hypothetical protein
MGDAAPRAVRVAAARPELIEQVICPASTPFGRSVTEGSEALAASDSVLELLYQQMTRDYRAALHRMIEDANPQLDAEELRERIDTTIERCPQEAAAARLRAWADDDATDAAVRVGDRLWLLEFGDNPWFPASLWEKTRRLVPDAHVTRLEDGPISRPDLAAEVVRNAVARSRASA